jgi:hypothetical protein
MRPESGVAAYDVEDVTLIDSTAISSAVDVDGVKEHDEQREGSTMEVTHTHCITQVKDTYNGTKSSSQAILVWHDPRIVCAVTT